MTIDFSFYSMFITLNHILVNSAKVTDLILRNCLTRGRGW